MPITVKGQSYHPVILHEIRETVYFGQTRVFSDFQRATSATLQDAVASGKLAVLSETPLQASVSSFIPREPSESVPPQELQYGDQWRVAAPQASIDLDALASRLADHVLSKLPVNQVENVPSVPAQPAADTVVAKAIEGMSAKLDQIGKLVVSGAGVGAVAVLAGTEGSERSVEDVFVPTIKVEDMTNHLQLETRSLGQGTQVNQALATLKRLQSKQS